MRNDTMQRRRTRPRADIDREPAAEAPEDYDYAERGFFSRTADEVMSWFGDDEAEARRKFDALMDRKFGSNYHNRAPVFTPWNHIWTSPHSAGRTVGTNMAFGMTESADSGQAGVRSRSSAEDYVDWRNRKIDSYDRDYEEYMREKQERFDREFSQWRKKRYEQRLAVGTVKEGQEVAGSDGKKVGTVDYIRGDRVVLTKSDPQAGGHHHSFPSSWIDKVTKKVVLNRTAEEAQDEWRDIEARKAFFESDYESDDPAITDTTYARTLHDKV